MAVCLTNDVVWAGMIPMAHSPAEVADEKRYRRQKRCVGIQNKRGFCYSCWILPPDFWIHAL
jgi:hypothetical protein